MPQIPQDLSYFKQRAELSPGEEAEFRKWYLDWAWRTQIDPDPDNPQHKYDYRAAWKAGVEPEYNPADKQYHWDSRFKDWDHPNLFAEGINTRTGYPAEMPGEFPWRQGTVKDGWKPASTRAFGETALAMASGIPRFIAQTGLTLGGVVSPVSPTFGNFATSRESAIEATEPIQYKPKSKEGQALTETVSTPFRILYELKDKLRDALYPDPALMKGRAFFDTAFDTLLLLAPKARGGLRAWAEHARKTRPTGGLPMGPAGAIDLTKNPTTGAWEFKPQDVATVAKIIEFNTPAEVKTTVRPILDELVKRAETAAKAEPAPAPIPEGGTVIPKNTAKPIDVLQNEVSVEMAMKNQGLGGKPIVPPVGPGIAPPTPEPVHSAFKPAEQSLNQLFTKAVEDGDVSPMEYNRALLYAREHPDASFVEIMEYLRMLGMASMTEPPGTIAPVGAISEVPVDTTGAGGGYPYEMVEQKVGGGGAFPEQDMLLPKVYKDKGVVTPDEERQISQLVQAGMPYSEALQRIMDAKKGPLGGGTPPPVPVVPPTGPPTGPPPAPAQASQQPQPQVQYEMTTAGPQPVYQAAPSKAPEGPSSLGKDPDKDAVIFNRHLLPTQSKVTPEQLRHLYAMIDDGQIPSALLNPAVEYIKDDPKITRSQLISKLRSDYDFDSLLAGEGWPTEPVKPASHYLPEVVEQKVTTPTYGTTTMEVEVAGLKPREGEAIGGLSTAYLKSLINNFMAEELEVYDEVSSVQNLGNGKIVIHTNNLTPSAYGELRKAITNGKLVIGPPTPEPKKLDFSYYDQHGIEQPISEGMGRQVSQLIRDLKAVDEWQKARTNAKPLTMSQLEDLIGPVDQPLYKYVTDRYIETGNIKRRSGLPEAEIGRYATGGDKPQLYIRTHAGTTSTFRDGGGIYLNFPETIKIGTLSVEKAIKDILGSVNVRPVVTRVGNSKFKVTVDRKYNDTEKLTLEDLEELRDEYMRDIEMAFRNENYTVPGIETIQKIASQDIVPEPNELPIKESPQSLVRRSKSGHSELVLVDARSLWRDLMEGIPPNTKNDPFFDLSQDPANPKGLDAEGEEWEVRPPKADDAYPIIDVYSGKNDILAGLPSKTWREPEVFLELRKAVVDGKKIRIAVKPKDAATAAERWATPKEPPAPRKMPAIQHRATPPGVQWHGSRAYDFQKGYPDAGRHLGVHVGTLDQASNHSFIGWRINPDNPDTWGAVHKMVLNMKNPIEIPDLGSWEPLRIVEELRKLQRAGKLDIEPSEFTELEREIGDVTVSDMPKYSQGFYVDVQQRKPVVQFLRKHGYDGIIYLNRTEGTLPREQRVAAILFDPANQAFIKEAYKMPRQAEQLPTSSAVLGTKKTGDVTPPQAVILHGEARGKAELYPRDTFMREFGKPPTIEQKKAMVQRGYMTDDEAMDAFLHKQRMPKGLMLGKVSRPWAGQPTPGVNEEKPRTYSQKYLGTMPSLERRARLKKLYGAKPMDEFGRRLEALGGDPELIAKWTNTSWGQLVTRSVDMHEELLDIIGGKPQWGATKSKLPGPMKSRLIPLVQKHGKEALWKYLDETGIIGGASKPVMAVPSSFINCRPSAQCVNTCFASTGTSKMSNVLAKGITIEMAVQEDPVRAGDMMYDQYKNSPLGKSENHALRFFDRGEGSDNWAIAIKRFNERGGRAQVFSKVPSFLNQVDPKNVRLLSIDTTNASVAEGNDLPIALNYEGRKSLALLNKYKDRIQVILPMVGGESKRIKSIVPPGEVELLTGWARPYVCPVDMAAVRAENPAISDKERAALKEKAGRWNCPMCDKGMGVGCFHKNTTDKTNFKK